MIQVDPPQAYGITQYARTLQALEKYQWPRSGHFPHGGNQMSLAIAAGFVYLAAILDAWSRRVVGYAISRSIDARLTLAALKVAIRSRQPPKGCVHHSDSKCAPASCSWAA